VSEIEPDVNDSGFTLEVGACPKSEAENRKKKKIELRIQKSLKNKCHNFHLGVYGICGSYGG
jgi:hypothetical protein